MNTTAGKTAEQQRLKAQEATLARVSRAWGPDMSPKDLGDDYKPLNEALEAASEALNTTWLACRAGTATMADFTAALSAWESANYRVLGALKGMAR